MNILKVSYKNVKNNTIKTIKKRLEPAEFRTACANIRKGRSQ